MASSETSGSGGSGLEKWRNWVKQKQTTYLKKMIYCSCWNVTNNKHNIKDKGNSNNNDKADNKSDDNSSNDSEK